jgi:hypothetical protein
MRLVALVVAGLICAAASSASANEAPIERPFDAAAWPKQLVVRHVQTGPDENKLTPYPDQTRKSMVRDLVDSGRLIGMRMSDVTEMLGKGQFEDGILFYTLGETPIGDYNPVILGIFFDPIGRVAAAKAVG